MVGIQTISDSALYECGHSGLFVDLLMSALLHGCISGHSEQVVAQSEEKWWERHQTLKGQTLYFHLFNVTKVTCSKTWQLLDLPLPPAQLEPRCEKYFLKKLSRSQATVCKKEKFKDRKGDGTDLRSALRHTVRAKCRAALLFPPD